MARSFLQFLIVAACTTWLAACGSTAVTSTAPSTISKCGLTLASPPSAISSSGGRQQVELTTTPECTWTASAEASWVTHIEPSSGQGSGTLQIDIAPNPTASARQTGVLVNGVRAQIQQLAAACEYVVSGSGSQSVAGSGGTFQVTVSAAAGCPWTAASSVTWVRVASGSPGNGTGVASFAVDPNAGSERVAALTIAGQSFTVFQSSAGAPQLGGPAECSYVLNPVSLGVPATDSGGSVGLTTACAWTATANVPWITVSSPSGTGSATVSFTVAANTGTARSGTISIGTATATINQAAAAPCSFGVSATTVAFEAAASTGSVNVSGIASCSWTATSTASWITITAGSAGSGNGAVAFRVAANTGTPRSGTLTVAGHVVTVNQAAECIVTANPLDFSIAATGATGQGLTVTTGSTCPWTATSNASWINITSGASGTGTGFVIFTVAANTGASRQGTLTVAGHAVTVSQAANCTVTASQLDFSIAGTGATAQGLTVTTGSTCTWTATSNASWITITTGTSGTGVGFVVFNVAANTGAARLGTLNVAEHVATVTQAANCTVTPSPLDNAIAAAGATGRVVTVTAGSGCGWNATSNASWITITSGASGSGGGSVTFNVAANTGASREGTLTVAGQAVTVTQAGNCTVTPSPLDFSIAAGGATGRVVTVAAGGGCGWTATSNASWLTITAGASGSGGGSVTFSVAANTGASRGGTLTVAGQAVTVTQAGNCTVTPSPLDFSIAAAGATGRVVTVSAGGGCGWTATSNAPWLTITAGASGSGGGSVTFSVAANTGAGRSGTLTVAGQAVTITQAGSCTLTASPLAFSVTATGATGQTVTVGGGTGCAWTASSNAPWLTITSGASGSGAGSVVFSVAANTGGARNGMLTVAGQAVTVSQSAPCTYSVTPPKVSVPGAGGPGSFTVAAAAGCAWTSTTTTPWLTITSGASGSGNGPVTFTASQNPGGARTGSLFIAGETVSVDQAAGCTYTASVTPRSFSDDGGTAVATVGTAAGCSWTVTSDSTWIVVPPPATRSGPGTVSITIQPNPGNKRDGVLTVAGQTFAIDQKK